MEKPDYELSETQKRFVRLCKKHELKIDYGYSGRFMYGRKCPSVVVDHLSEFPGNPHKFQIDDMGLGKVVYCKD